MEEGIVIKSTGKWYQVKTPNGEVLPCRIIGKFRLENKRITNPIAVGDRVKIEREPGTEPVSAVIRKILPRDNYIVRQSPRRKHAMHMLASNLDAAILIVTVVEPQLKQGFIDRFLLMTEPYQIPTYIIFNKSDLYSERDMAVYDYMKDLYEAIGYKIILTSTVSGLGLDAVKDVLSNKITFVGGQSGVGKSSLVNALQPNLHLATSEISGYSGKGQHTTTFAEWHDLEGGGAIIDTPGIKNLTFNHFEPIEVAHNFREFFEVTGDCRFGATCLHRGEPKCAVKAGVEEGSISEFRYANYLQLLEEVEAQNYWERRKDY